MSVTATSTSAFTSSGTGAAAATLTKRASIPAITVNGEKDARGSPERQADILIIGAGVVGCALAAVFGKQGRRVLLLEKSLKEPDRIVGELLQPGGVEALEKLGLQGCLEGIDAIAVDGYNVILRGTHLKIPYPVDKKTGIAPKGRSFHHGRFIMKLREAAKATPNVTIIEATATTLIKSHSDVIGVEATVGGAHQHFFAPLTVVADGYASKFRKEYHPRTPVVKSKFWGMELIDAELPMPQHGHVFIGYGAPVLMYQIGTHETRALIDIPENLPSASVQNGGVKGHMRNVILPSLPESLQPSFLAALEKGGLRSMPNSFLPSSPNKTRGLIILGDASNMRHPLTGGGMTVAFNDVVVLQDLLSPENVPTFADAPLVTKKMKTFHWRRKNAASVINILAQALYSVFAGNDPNLAVLQRGCFRYFELGMIEQPAGMLGGIIKDPSVLVRHFFSVAFLSIWVMIAESPIYLMPVAFLRSFVILYTACVVIMPYIFAELER
ncbi:squalene monooxygenase [Talaromyces proteolyticus]|uniref:Squalene monooxygenase n=1 Tax=Talaromyces proteolyticus TaxID=1131652 RepID=A0AAD4Q479_9EURO|nr:squalene monooxygenase [Talaromyces proteolyticus]KAH8702412.1 squalene monooxygenase [Talaromyces proteolyticus]